MPALAPARREPVQVPMTPTERNGLRLYMHDMRDHIGRLIRQLDRGDRSLTVDGPLQAAAVLSAVEFGEPGRTLPALRTRIRTLLPR